MICRRNPWWIVVAGLVLAGCSGAPSPAKSVWSAQPPVVARENPRFRAVMEPRKGDLPYFTSFLVTLTNKSDAAMVIDWNASRYLFNGSPQGMLVFPGIDPAAVGSGAVPPETVAPGATVVRDLMPLRLIAWQPLREKTASSRGILPGLLPAGVNGVQLAVGHAGGPMAISLTVRLSAAPAQ